MALASESKRHERTNAGLINRALSLKRCRAKTDATPVSGARGTGGHFSCPSSKSYDQLHTYARV
jgi:hypothetical protein